MRILKYIFLALLTGFIIIQFFRPARNISGQVLPTDITKQIEVPESVLAIFKSSCYDCHSNNTRYPWYVHVQPMGWIMAGHIKDGKENLNFSEFGNYSKRRQVNKLRAIATSMKEGTMPIPSYTMLHTDAKLSEENKKSIVDWVTVSKERIEK